MNKEALEAIPCSACVCVDSQHHAANVVTTIFVPISVLLLFSGFKDLVESSKGVN